MSFPCCRRERAVGVPFPPQSSDAHPARAITSNSGQHITARNNRGTSDACLCEDQRGNDITPDDKKYTKEIEALLIDFMKFDLNNGLGIFTPENLRTAIAEQTSQTDTPAKDDAQDVND